MSIRILLTLTLLLATAAIAHARSADDIRQTVREHRSEIKACYDEALERDPKLEGELVVSFTIAEDGSVIRAATSSSTLGAPALERCVVEAVESWDFGEAEGDGPTQVSYPFRFSLERGATAY